MLVLKLDLALADVQYPQRLIAEFNGGPEDTVEHQQKSAL